MTNYDGLTRNTWTGTWSPTSDHPIVLDSEIRGSLRYISGSSGDQLTDISGQRLQEGMLVYVKNSYVNGSGFTIQGDEYYTYSLGQGETRDPGTGQMPNSDSNWEQAQLGGGDPGTLSLSTRNSSEEIPLNVNNSFNLSLRSGIATVQSTPGTIQVGVGTGSVAGIDTQGTSTFNQLNSTNLNVSGISTFQGLGNFRSNLYIGNDDGSGNRTLFIGDNQYFTLKSLGGLDSIIEHNSTSSGDLYLLSGRDVYLRTANGESSASFKRNGPVELYYNNFKRLETTATGLNVYGGASISGIVTVGAGTSDKGLESPSYKLSNNNQTLVGTSGTIGDIKMILGSPFFYDGTAWREFYLKEGREVTQSADTEWDNVIYRNTFDSSFTDIKFQLSPISTTNADLVTSPRKFGSKALRLQDGNVSYAHTSDYVFDGNWTIEGWFYWDTLPDGTGSSSDVLVSKSHPSSFSNADWAIGLTLSSTVVNLYWKNENHPTYNTASGVTLGSYTSSSFDKQWHHIAVVREASNGSIHLYVDGYESTGTYNNQVIDNNILDSSNAELNLGYSFIDVGSRFFDGIIDDLRISKVARYTSVGITTEINFIPPTEAYPITGTLTGPFEPAYYGEITDLGDLYNVSAATPSTGQVLKWNGVEWAPASDLTSTGGTGIGLTDLSVTTNPVGGLNSLVYDDTTGTFTFTPTSLVGYATETYVDNAVSGIATTGYVDNAIVGFITAGASGAGLTALTGAAAGIYGDNGNSAQITVDANGRITNITQVAITTDGAGVNVSGISTFNDNVSFGSTILVDGSVRLTGLNTSIVGTSGTTGDIKVIGGSPFFYDGTAWREFSLTSGKSVTLQEDSEWDNVTFRTTFDSNYTDSRFNTLALTSSNASIVTSPTKIGSGALRLQDGYVSYDHINDYVFNGEWTIEGWFYWDTLPDGVGSSSDTLVSKTTPSTFADSDWTIGLTLSSTVVNIYWKNQNHPTYNTTSGVTLGGYVSSSFLQQWHHIAVVREPLDGSIHLYVDGYESTGTYNNQVIDNNILDSSSATLNLGYAFIDGGSRFFDGIIDDVRISKVARYTSVGVTTEINFTPPTTALPTTGTLTTLIDPPGDTYGEIGLGTSPTWRGTSGVTVSQQSSGNYRVTFTSSYTNSNDYYVLSQGMDQGFASYVGIARSTTHVDLTINKQSDDTTVDTGSLSVQIKNHI